MVIGDDDVDAGRQCGGRRVMGGRSAIDRHDHLRAGVSGALDVNGLESVALAHPIWKHGLDR